MRTLTRWAAAAAAGLALASPAAFAATQTLSYADFSSVAGLQINGNASQQGSKLNLTPPTFNQSGTAFSTSTIALTADASFSTAFTFEILQRGGLGGGADGLTFTVQTQANNVGGIGGGIGYAGITPSVTVEFDTFDNGEVGASNHVAIHQNGNPSSPLASTPEISPDFDNGSVWHAWVDYNGSSKLLEVRWADSASRPFAAGLSATVDLPSVLGSPDVYVGFTSGTGSGYGEHNVLSWGFVNEYRDGGITPSVPEPGTWAMLALGLAGLGAVRRRAAA